MNRPGVVASHMPSTEDSSEHMPMPSCGGPDSVDAYVMNGSQQLPSQQPQPRFVSMGDKFSGGFAVGMDYNISAFGFHPPYYPQPTTPFFYQPQQPISHTFAYGQQGPPQQPPPSTQQPPLPASQPPQCIEYVNSLRDSHESPHTPRNHLNEVPAHGEAKSEGPASSPKPQADAAPQRDAAGGANALAEEVVALQAARIFDARQLAQKDLEIQKLREEVEALRLCFSHQQQQHEQLRQGGGAEAEEDGPVSKVVNSMFAVTAQMGKVNVSVREVQQGQIGDRAGVAPMEGENGILDAAVAAAAEETLSNVFGGGPAATAHCCMYPELMVPRFNGSAEFVECELDPFGQSTYDSQGSSSSSSLARGGVTSLSPVSWTLKPSATPATANSIAGPPGSTVAGGSKSIWGPLKESSGELKNSSIPEYLHEAKEFVPAGIVSFASTMDTTDTALNRVRSIWELDDSVLFSSDGLYDTVDSEDISMKGCRNHKGFLHNGVDRHNATTFQHLVDKIVRTQDQPASLLLQQKLKVNNHEIRSQIMDAILHQALNLIRNRFGNFLVQRCLEVGDPCQIRALAGSMLGCIVMLSCDRFGCHVVQKVLDVCDDEMKALIVNELLHAIPDTITHRFACHVWQRVFETKWAIHPYSAAGGPYNHHYHQQMHYAVQNHFQHSSYNHQLPQQQQHLYLPNLTHLTAPQLQPQAQEEDVLTANFTLSSNVHPVISIVRCMDAVLHGQWHSIANDESGSLVVQCIFENCPESEKRGIIQEVLSHAADIAKGQWGNWVIQHLLDRGYQPDKAHILHVVSHHIHSLSVDQFASKVVEKALKTCPKKDLYSIVDRVVNGSLGETGNPAILDMMNNQYANYVVQHILTLAEPQQRDTCARLISPHLALLRGSKYGQRVAAIVEKHLRSTRDKFGPSLPANVCSSGHGSNGVGSVASGVGINSRQSEFLLYPQLVIDNKLVDVILS
ncbi:armadillo-type protein [Chytriomyces sp. MP71]|nr:armadillo-type protein [Chytriomyces sp. MP71]